MRGCAQPHALLLSLSLCNLPLALLCQRAQRQRALLFLPRLKRRGRGVVQRCARCAHACSQQSALPTR